MDDRLPLDHPVPGGTTVRGFDASLGTDGEHIAFLVPIYVRASQLTVDGQPLEPLPGAAALEASPVNAWYYDDHLHRTIIKIIDDHPSRLIQLKYQQKNQ